MHVLFQFLLQVAPPSLQLLPQQYIDTVPLPSVRPVKVHQLGPDHRHTHGQPDREHVERELHVHHGQHLKVGLHHAARDAPVPQRPAVPGLLDPVVDQPAAHHAQQHLVELLAERGPVRHHVRQVVHARTLRHHVQLARRQVDRVVERERRLARHGRNVAEPGDPRQHRLPRRQVLHAAAQRIHQPAVVDREHVVEEAAVLDRDRHATLVQLLQRANVRVVQRVHEHGRQPGRVERDEDEADEQQAGEEQPLDAGPGEAQVRCAHQQYEAVHVQLDGLAHRAGRTEAARQIEQHGEPVPPRPEPSDRRFDAPDAPAQQRPHARAGQAERPEQRPDVGGENVQREQRLRDAARLPHQAADRVRVQAGGELDVARKVILDEEAGEHDVDLAPHEPPERTGKAAVREPIAEQVPIRRHRARQKTSRAITSGPLYVIWSAFDALARSSGLLYTERNTSIRSGYPPKSVSGTVGSGLPSSSCTSAPYSAAPAGRRNGSYPYSCPRARTYTRYAPRVVQSVPSSRRRCACSGDERDGSSTSRYVPAGSNRHA
uniref:Uncharacterized protein n=1 Tax=Anopheles merus TaxID=30066 RepID=A0A182VC58_ANOME